MFVLSYTPPLGVGTRVVAVVLAAALALVALWHLYVRPTSLGRFREPGRRALLVYGGCVVGELAAIAGGSRLLTAVGRGELRPALIAAVVGLHFVPFAWAFGERLFSRLGLALIVLGGLGLGLGYAGVAHAADAAAVLSGLIMLALVVRYARGRFAPRRGEG